MPLREAREAFDRAYLEHILAATAGDIDHAAELAEIHPKSFARLMRRYRLNREAFRAQSDRASVEVHGARG